MEDLPQAGTSAAAVPTAPPLDLTTPEGIRALIQRKEGEVMRLREARTRQVEQQLQEQRGELQHTATKLQKLQSDFQYNLGLLDERDQELEVYDREYARLQAEAAEKDRHLMEARAAIAHHNSELKQAQLRATEAEGQFRQKAVELREAAESARYTKEESLLRQKEEFDVERRGLRREIKNLEDEMQASRREIASSFGEKLQRMELDHKARAEELTDRADRAERLQEQSEALLAEARAREEESRTKAFDFEEKLREAQRRLEQATFELENAQHLHDDQLAEKAADLETSKRDFFLQQEEWNALREDLNARVKQLEGLLEGERAEAGGRLARQQEAWVSESASMRARLDTAEARQRAAEEKLEESTSGFRVARRELEDKLAQEKAEKVAAANAHERLLEEKERAHAAGVQELQENLWARDTELSAMRGKIDFMKKALDKRREDITAYKSQIVAGNEKTRELNRKLVANQLRAEADVQSTEAAVTASNETLIQQLTAERDRALKLISMAEEKAAQAQAESARLQGEIRAIREAGRSPGRPPVPELSPRLQAERLAGQPHSARGGGGPSYALSISDVPSPSVLPSLPPSPPLILPEAPQMKAAVESLTPRSLADPDEAAAGPYGVSPHGDALRTERQNQELRNLVAQLEGENTRLKGSIGALRTEMEALHQAPAAGAGPAPAADAPVESLRSEARRLEHELVKAQEYVDILQRRLGPHAADADVDAELAFLRGRLRELSDENQRLRRELAAAGRPGAGAGASVVEEEQSELRRVKVSLNKLKQDLRSRALPIFGAAAPAAGLNPMGAESVAAEVSLVVNGLVTELVSARGDVDRLTHERDRVMDMSNSLRAELDKVAKPVSRDLSELDRSQLSGMEAAIAELREQNRALAASQQRVLERGTSELHSIAAEAARPWSPAGSPAASPSRVTFSPPPGAGASRPSSAASAASAGREAAYKAKLASARQQLELAGSKAPHTSVASGRASHASRAPELTHGTASQKRELTKLKALTRRREEGRDRNPWVPQKKP